MRSLTLVILGLFSALAVQPGEGVSTPPQPGWIVKGNVVEVYDGDTITFEYKKRIKVRLLDCWAPEVRGEQRPEGLVSRDKLRGLALGKTATLFVPETEDVQKSITFGRFLGHVWIKNSQKSISELQVEAGMATKEKE